MISEKVIELIKAELITDEPRNKVENDDGTVTYNYLSSVEVDGVTYDYNISWTGLDNGEDEGEWSEPEDIVERVEE